MVFRVEFYNTETGQMERHDFNNKVDARNFVYLLKNVVVLKIVNIKMPINVKGA